ncbi:hypothetical protein HHK36_001266 [Tetracentron sinense]|uniref:Disease resistance protein At4g27190-like leucine-rich repeats domain-containing protein n=1 Tax=Tetracentron sinense TaxID=13715 RepID=A0A834ZXB5_TETSI|nr:hypothetical protein HHK36_001266 [Tetracentron sinense]
MDNLVEWLEVSAVVSSCFPRLEDLIMRNCPKLKTMPSRFTSLTSLYIDNLQELEFLPEWSPQNNKNIRSMSIWDCHKLEAIISSKRCEGIIQRESEERLQMQALETLQISRCSRLKSIIPDVQWDFTSLRELHIQDCHELTCLLDGQHRLKSLKKLSISDCPII